MKIKAFAVEEWMNAYETGAKYNIAETCVNSVSLNELFGLAGEDQAKFWRAFGEKRLTYGCIEGMPALREGICGLYKTVKPEEVITTHGAAGANHHLLYSLIEPGDHVISIMPTYQQLYSIPESFGADVKMLHLTQENGFLPDLDELRRLAVPAVLRRVDREYHVLYCKTGENRHIKISTLMQYFPADAVYIGEGSRENTLKETRIWMTQR